eukprot:TRINITY_DN9591_c0_g1_i1.p1 TRINITY_DN9591_c0_g1~~TRINITY_DN9591_c0_g1_i1.p1  ORF type:complete len:198 (-),score=53.23 TRINITY_DN9591_c0_g1_i1:19-612(-)
MAEKKVDRTTLINFLKEFLQVLDSKELKDYLRTLAPDEAKIAAAIDNRQRELFIKYGIPVDVGFATLKNAKNLFPGDVEVIQLLMTCAINEETTVAVAAGAAPPKVATPQNPQQLQQMFNSFQIQLQQIMEIAKNSPEKLTSQQKQLLMQVQQSMRAQGQTLDIPEGVLSTHSSTNLSHSTHTDSAPKSLDMDDDLD